MKFYSHLYPTEEVPDVSKDPVTGEDTGVVLANGMPDAMTINNVTGQAGSPAWVNKNIDRYVIKPNKLDQLLMVSMERAANVGVISEVGGHIRAAAGGTAVRWGVYSTKHAPLVGVDGPDYGHCIPSAFFAYRSRFTKPWKMRGWKEIMRQVHLARLPVNTFFINGYIHSRKWWQFRDYLNWCVPLVRNYVTIRNPGEPPRVPEIVVVTSPRIHAGAINRWKGHYDTQTLNMDPYIWDSHLNVIDNLHANTLITLAGRNPREWSSGEPWWLNVLKRSAK